MELAGRSELRPVGLEGHLDALLDPGRIAVVRDPALAVFVPAPRMNVEPQPVARLEQALERLGVPGQQVVGRAVHGRDLRVATKKPQEPHLLTRRGGEPWAQAFEVLEDRIDAAQRFSVRDLHVTLVRLEVDAEKDGNPVHPRAYATVEGSVAPRAARKSLDCMIVA